MTRVGLRCSFCARPQAAVAKLVAGPNVYVCNICIDDALGLLTPSERRPVRVEAEPDAMCCSLGAGAAADATVDVSLSPPREPPPERLGALARLRFDADARRRRCAFCGKAHSDVSALLAGGDALICDACTRLSHAIVLEELRLADAPPRDLHAPLTPFVVPHGVRLLNHRHGYQLDVTRRGVFLSSLVTWSMQLVSIARDPDFDVDLAAVDGPAPELDADARRVWLVHGPWAREAFVNEPDETVHDIELLQRPPGDPTQPVRLVYAVRGTLRPKIQREGIDFTDPAGSVAVRYRNRRWRDANDQDVHVHVRLGDDSASIELLIDDTNAHYPLRIELGSS